jgi:DNA polymerase-3 subunit epsilon
MKDFVAIDFETGNPQRVSVCAVGYAKVSDGNIIETKGYLLKPIGGHALFQSNIHGLTDEHTFDKPEFRDIFPEIKEIFNYPLVGHGLFDKQVLNALSDHFDLDLSFNYTDSIAIAKEKLPALKNHKLKTLVKHFRLPNFKHHDAAEDALACANVFLHLQNITKEEPSPGIADEVLYFRGMVRGILLDDDINYKELCALLYWLEDHPGISAKYQHLYLETKEALNDGGLDCIEVAGIKKHLEETLRD